MLPSYCSECDAPPGDCNHTAPRYLDPIVYEPTTHGWKVPDHERHRWENPPTAAPKPTAGSHPPKPIHRLITELEAWMFVDRQLEQSVRATYDLEPLRVTMLVEHLVHLAEAGKLTNPPGLLTEKLKELATNA